MSDDQNLLLWLEALSRFSTKATTEQYQQACGAAIVEIERLKTAIAQEREALANLRREIWDLIDESEGVAGLHRNGDVATWDELIPGGRFERLTSLGDDPSAISARSAPPSEVK